MAHGAALETLLQWRDYIARDCARALESIKGGGLGVTRTTWRAAECVLVGGRSVDARYLGVVRMSEAKGKVRVVHHWARLRDVAVTLSKEGADGVVRRTTAIVKVGIGLRYELTGLGPEGAKSLDLSAVGGALRRAQSRGAHRREWCGAPPRTVGGGPSR